jgi:hypothetical protein
MMLLKRAPSLARNLVDDLKTVPASATGLDDRTEGATEGNDCMLTANRRLTREALPRAREGGADLLKRENAHDCAPFHSLSRSSVTLNRCEPAV